MSWRLIIVATLLLVCGPAVAQPVGFSPAMEAALSSTDNDDLARQFYQQRSGALAWSGSARTDARLAIAVLANAASEGLDPERYRVSLNSGNATADDVAISTAVLTYMRDLALGRPDLRTLDTDVALSPRSLDTSALLNDALHQGRLAAMLGSLAPQYPEYAALRAALTRNAMPADIIAANLERWRRDHDVRWL